MDDKQKDRSGCEKPEKSPLDSLTMYRSIFENSRDAIGISKAGIHLFVNPAYLELFGFPPGSDLERKPVLDLIAPASRDQISNYVRRRLQGEAVPSTYETRGLRADGTEFDMEVNVSVYQESGEDRTLVILRDITERKQAAEEIAEHGALVQQIMDTASVAIFLVDRTGRIVHANKRMAEMFGCTMNELAGSEYVDHVHPSEREIGRQKMLALLASEIDSVDLERLYRRRDGHEFWGHLAGRRFHDVHGNNIGLIGVITDINERKRSEAALKQSEAKYRRLYNETPVLLHSIDTDGTLVEVNDYWLKTMGYERTEVIGRKMTDFYTDASRTYFDEVVRPAFLRDGMARDISYQFIKKNGDVVDVILSATAERDAEGNIVRSQAVIENVIDRKRSEEKLRESEAKFRGLVEQSPIAFLIVGRSGSIEYINKKHHEIVGYSVEQIPTLDTWWALAYPDAETRQRTMAAWEGLARKILNGENVGPIERTIACKDGSSKDIEMRFSLAGEKIYVVFVDITERKQLEQELIKAQKLESVGTLAGGIAHDFNNLLQGVFGYISMAKLTHDQKEKSLAMLDQAEEALHMSVNLTTQLLTFSKGGKPTKKLMRLEPTIENAVKFALSGSHTDYQLDIVPGLWPVEADAGQLAQVIQNIVLNANEAMAGRGTVTITVGNMDIPSKADLRLPEGGQLIRIDIQDTGKGISEQNIVKIFDPYFTTKQKGSGLGLATSYSIIKNHGGLIEVKSEINRGTTFSIYLPASRGAEVETVMPAVSAVIGTKKFRILLMDDEDLVRNVAKEMIAALGHEVEGAEDGKRAIELFQQARETGRPFDLLILDLTIKGGMGGEEAITNIRHLDPNVKAVVSSGYADSPIVADYRAYGFSAVLNKPYRLDTLKECISLFIS